MNEDCRKRGLSNKKILTVVAISTLLLSSGNVIATQTTIDGSLRVTEQLQTQIVNGLVVDVNGEPVIGASVVEKGTTNGGITDINGKFTLNVEAVLISFDKFVKHDLDECDLYHDFRSFSEEFIIDG